MLLSKEYYNTMGILLTIPPPTKLKLVDSTYVGLWEWVDTKNWWDLKTWFLHLKFDSTDFDVKNPNEQQKIFCFCFWDVSKSIYKKPTPPWFNLI